MKDVDITANSPFLPLDDGELLDEEAIELTTSWITASCIGCKPTPLGGAQSVANMVKQVMVRLEEGCQVTMG